MGANRRGDTCAATSGKSEATLSSQQQVQAVQLTQQQQKFTGLRSNGNGRGWNNRFFQLPSLFLRSGRMNQHSILDNNTQQGFLWPYTQTWTELVQQQLGQLMGTVSIPGALLGTEPIGTKLIIPKYPKPSLGSNHELVQQHQP
ncbi:MAG: hypothetical protein EZS28_001066 [Streblomastix strix]|uniref:Uncharacterized protein n=1 Tax=Streblomastix strix TaxID=222440 RepID=A0A5J4X8C2_9EUKA|nr:MAG: hypothetical protein EZS28_001066 [Streblomastix strix]